MSFLSWMEDDRRRGRVVPWWIRRAEDEQGIVMGGNGSPN